MYSTDSEITVCHIHTLHDLLALTKGIVNVLSCRSYLVKVHPIPHAYGRTGVFENIFMEHIQFAIVKCTVVCYRESAHPYIGDISRNTVVSNATNGPDPSIKRFPQLSDGAGGREPRTECLLYILLCFV